MLANMECFILYHEFVDKCTDTFTCTFRLHKESYALDLRILRSIPDLPDDSKSYLFPPQLISWTLGIKVLDSLKSTRNSDHSSVNGTSRHS
jgi:hypothetical protein